MNKCGVCNGPAFINHDKLGPLCRPCALDLIQQAIDRPAATVIDLDEERKKRRKQGSMSFKDRYTKEAGLPCLGCGRKKGNNDGQCPKKDGPECKAYLREKTRGAIDIGVETNRN